MTKLNKEQRLEIYNQWKLKCLSANQIAKHWKLNRQNVSYMIKLIDRYGIDIYDRPNESFSKEFKEEAIEKYLLGTQSFPELALNLGLRSCGMLSNWVREYKENGYNVVIKKKGRHSSHEAKEVTQGAEKEDPAARRRKLEIAYRQCLRKKTKRLGSETTEEIAQAITELRQAFKVSLKYILETIAESPDLPQIAKSTYYYTISKPAKIDNHPDLTQKIKEIFEHHKRLYGYRRVFLQLVKEGWNATIKQVRLIMHKLGLKGRKRNKRKYSSYRGTIGKIAPDHIKRHFFAICPNMKWYTDISEFHLNNQKLYLSPILDGCGGEIVSFAVSKHPDLDLVNEMLDKAFAKHKALNALVFHTDQGCQYQSPVYQRRLKLRGITQSMSRKGNSMDDGLMENFFGLLKTEIFYDQEYKYHSLDELAAAIGKYIEYYNNERIKERLKGLTPIEYRNQALVS